MFACAFEQHREKGVATLLLVALAIYDVPGLPPLNIIGYICICFFCACGYIISWQVFKYIKPWDDETDMQKLEEAVRSVQMEGLLWGAWYGIKKLQIMLTIVDDLVSVDTLIEEHLTVEPINEYVQSCEIVAFNKI
ncbi:putative translation elongation factor EF1B/ribosomal protein S6 [Helianthus anomalus]